MIGIAILCITLLVPDSLIVIQTLPPYYALLFHGGSLPCPIGVGIIGGLTLQCLINLSTTCFFVSIIFAFPTGDICPIPMDTTFIVDTSNCDDESNWNRLLYFLQTLVTFFNVSPSGGRIAIISYGTDAKVVIKFNTLSGDLLTSAEAIRRVGLLQCLGGGLRRIDKALDLASKEVLVSAGGVRDISRVKKRIVHTRAVLVIVFSVHHFFKIKYEAVKAQVPPGCQGWLGT